ncbi:MAG: type IV secretion system protein VirB10 [Sphingobium sp.]
MSEHDMENEGLSGERGALEGPPRKRFGLDRTKVLSGVALIAVGGLALGLSMLNGGGGTEKVKRDEVIRTNTVFEPAPEKPKVEPEAVKVTSAPPARVVMPAPVEEPDPLLQSATRAPVIAFSAGSSQQRRTEPAQTLDGQGRPTKDSAEDVRFGQLMKPTVLQGSKAGTLGNRNFIVAMGASIPCVLETALSSDQPGFTSCVLPRDVLSDNGRVVLMPKGTQVIGEYRGGIKRGQSRLFVLWNRAKTPEGVIVTLASPATDGLGRAGFDGYVDSHFMERFGGALLLSVVSDASSWIGDMISDKSEISTTNTTQTGEDAASIAVEQSINIPPTLMKHQGEIVSIFVARDLDFSSVYDLKVTEPLQRVYDRGVMGDFSNMNPRITK